MSSNGNALTPFDSKSPNRTSFHEDSTLKRAVPTPKTMIRQKPPPKPPRMKPTMLDESFSPTDSSTPSREVSPGIISLKSSIVDATRTLDSPVMGGEYAVERTSRLSPAKNSHKEYWQNILEQIKPFVLLQVELEELLKFVCNQQTPTVDPGVKNGDEQTLWGHLVTVVLAREEEGFRALCNGLRHVGNLYLAELLHVLDMLLEIGIASDCRNDPNTELCSVCRFKHDNAGSEEAMHEVSRFDVEIICIDAETGQVKPLKEISVTKKPNRKLVLSPLKNDVDKYVPGISVSIFNQCFCNQGLDQLAKLLRQYSSIRELHIVKNHLDLEAIEKLFQGMHRSLTLQKLDLRLNTLDDLCASKLFTCFSGNASLRTINVASTGLTSTGLGHLLTAFSVNKWLTELDIGFNNVHNSGAKAMSHVLGSNCPLRKLRMRSNYMTPDGAKYIFQALKKNSRLHFLDISVNPIKDEGCNYISQALLCNRTLKEINLEDCSIRKAGCEMLARALKTNTNLKSLDLSRNPLGDEGVEALSEGVKYNQVLDILSLNMCEIANCGFSKLMDALQYNTTMTGLKLCYNLIGYPVVSSPSEDPTPTVQDIYERVCQILQTNKDLKVLLWGNRLDYDMDNDIIPFDNNGHPLTTNSSSSSSDERQLMDSLNGVTLERNSYHCENNNKQSFSKHLPKRAMSEVSVPTTMTAKEKQNWLCQ